MRINQYLAQATGMSRRAADQAITAGKVTINGKSAQIGQSASDADNIVVDGKLIDTQTTVTIMINKPVSYVVSRSGQGSKSIYDLLPKQLQSLKPAGRLDKDSSGLLVLSNDGDLIYRLTHPSVGKWKTYNVALGAKLSADHKHQLIKGIKLSDGLSKLDIKGDGKFLEVRLPEGRNRQIRRSFGALGYRVTGLHRVQMGDLLLGKLEAGKWQDISELKL